MKKIYKTLAISFCTLLAIFTSAYSQVKFEKEYSIKQEEVPKKALLFINAAFGNSKQKWHKELSQDGKSIETRIKKNKKKYSIEFDTLGKPQDVEITISMKNIAEITAKEIKNNFNKKFTKFKILKAQIQWTGNEQDLIKTIAENKVIGNVILHYEISIKASENNGMMKYYEALFNSDGTLKNITELSERNDDNLIY